MTILEYFSIPKEQRNLWCNQIALADWNAAVYLHKLLVNDSLQKEYGPDAKLYLLTQEDALQAFCLLTPKDEITDPTLYPWVGFVYTFPEYRGHRYSQILIDHACNQARAQGFRRIYLTSHELGLYEKYGFQFLETRTTVWNDMTRVLFREL